MSYTEVDANPTDPSDYAEANMGFYTNEYISQELMEALKASKA